jgi:isocitrate dehydrogenase
MASSATSSRMRFRDLKPPKEGARVTFKDGYPVVPDQPIIPFIEGDGIGKDIWPAARKVFDAALEKAYSGKRKVHWFEIFAGDKAQARYGQYLPDDTLEAIKAYGVAIKGPLGTPIGTGIRSLNVTLRQTLDLYSCVRPIHYSYGAPSPMQRPEDCNFVIFRENTEDLYSGIEWPADSPEAKKLVAFINELLSKDPSAKGKKVDESAAVGIKPMTRFRSQRNMRRAVKYAITHGIRDICIVHKGNIMKFTEGGFREWCYELATDEFRDKIVTEEELKKQHNWILPPGRVLVKDRIADNMFQQILLYPKKYYILVCTNVIGDLLSDAAAAQIGGLGIAPGANIGDNAAVFEATHGTAPDIAGQDKANPSAVIFSGAMMFEYFGWLEARDLIHVAVEKTVRAKTVTGDFAMQMPGAKTLSTTQFAEAVIANM